MLDPETCYRALQARDARFDGRIFVGVTSTGIYCRPVCPARTPKRENCQFYKSAAAAHEAGFRPCLRCRPETVLDLGSWRGTSNTVSRGLALIAEGNLDSETHVEALAERLGVGARQLRRLFQEHLGASPVAVAQTRRALFAKQLIQETQLPMAEVALFSGFGSVRRFNEVFRGLFQRSPSALRRTMSSLPLGSVAGSGVTVRLRYRAPYDWDAMLSHLRARAVDGVERVVEGCYRRTLVHEGRMGTVEIRHLPAVDCLAATIRFPSVIALPAIVARVRHVFDLGADVAAIGKELARDPLLAPLVAERPGLRVPGAWEGFELAARAILGQQVSVEAARQLAGQLVRLCGSRAPDVEAADDALTFAFPSAEQVARAALGPLKMPNSRRVALVAAANIALADPCFFEALDTVEETVARLRTIRGIGDWTAHYIALRAGREPDAFPSSDVGLLRSAARHGAGESTSASLLERAERWRPWRAYAAQHLWAADTRIRPTVSEGSP
jgi:AraC family transcriptional regulator, regulatory protein of adaptative response / DNA-3-methyladenine glycosylase II